MTKTTLSVALAALLTAAMPLYAQTAATSTNTNSTTAATASAGVAGNRLMPGQIRVTQMDGSTVYDTQNRNIGDVKDIILDRDGRVAAVILDVGSFLGMGGKYVAVNMGDIKVTWDNNNNNNNNNTTNSKPRFTVDMTKEQLKAAQAYDLNGNNTTGSTGTSTAPANNNR